ncbi:hypothetical protein V6N13_137541 [Hibiscus sabdariffa]
MQEIAKSNGNNLPEGVILALDDEVNKAPNGYQSCSQEEPGSMVDITRSPAIRIQLFLSVAINFTCSVVYYGISLNVVNLETDLHLSVLLNAVAEMLAFTITTVLLGRFGRKPLAIATQWFSAIFCLMGCFVGNVGIWKVIKLCCGALGIFGMAGTLLEFSLKVVEKHSPWKCHLGSPNGGDFGTVAGGFGSSSSVSGVRNMWIGWWVVCILLAGDNEQAIV